MNKGIEIIGRLRRFNERLDRGETIKAHRVDGSTTFTKRKVKTMAKKRAKKKTQKAKTDDVQQDEAFYERLAARAVVLESITFLMILQIFMQIFENCPEPDPDQITQRIANAPRRRQARMARRLQRKDRTLSDYDAANIIVGIVAEANENTEEFAAMVAEELDDKDED